MKLENQAWQKLVSVARLASDDRDTVAPYGFATRVAALAMMVEPEPTGVALFERFSWRALSVAALLALISVATNYSSFTGSSDDDLMSDESAIMALIDVS